MEPQCLEAVVEHQPDGGRGVALFPVLHVMYHDADACPHVVGVEIIEVHQPHGHVVFQAHNHHAQLLGLVNVLVGIVDVFLQREVGERRERVADIPEVHVVFPFIEVLKVFGLKRPDFYAFVVHHNCNCLYLIVVFVAYKYIFFLLIIYFLEAYSLFIFADAGIWVVLGDSPAVVSDVGAHWGRCPVNCIEYTPVI